MRSSRVVGYVGEPALGQCNVASVHEHHRDGIGCVRRMRAAGLWIAHQLAVAMVGREEQRAAGFANGVGNPAETRIHRLDGLDGRVQLAGVTDHVGIGVVQDDEVVFPRADSGDGFVGELRRRHLGLEIVGGHLRRRHHDAILTGIRDLVAAVQKYVTCGYFSVSAMRNCVRPAFATISPRTFGSVTGGKIVPSSLSRPSLYWAMPWLRRSGQRARAGIRRRPDREGPPESRATRRHGS